MEGMTTDAKHKWKMFATLAESETRETADYSAAKQCRMESLLQQCVSATESALKQWNIAQASLNDMGSKHVSDVVSVLRGACDSNEQHDADITSARSAVELDVATNVEDTFHQIDSISEQERSSITGILVSVKTHTDTIEGFRQDHSCQLSSMDEKAKETFRQHYTDYEPTGSTPTRSELDVPSKSTIESHRAMPMGTLVKEFRENHSFERLRKEPKPSLIPRAPLLGRN